jgi:hypothetical protein
MGLQYDYSATEELVIRIFYIPAPATRAASIPLKLGRNARVAITASDAGDNSAVSSSILASFRR